MRFSTDNTQPRNGFDIPDRVCKDCGEGFNTCNCQGAR